MDIIATLTKLEDSILETIESVQEPVVGSVRSAVQFVDARLPALPDVPYAEQLPSATELVDNGYGFAQRLLDANHEFAKAVLDAVSPLLADAAPAKPAPKATVKVAA